MLNDRSGALALLATRRSAKPRDMVAPGPTDAELAQMLALAARVPDHGKIAPWRFVVIPANRREAFAALLDRAWRAECGAPDAMDLKKVREFATQGAALVAVLSTPLRPHKIPVWEQELSAGAVCVNLLHAATAMGYAGCWLTGWAAYSPMVYAALGGEPGGRIAGFMFVGTAGAALEERPRPDLAAIARAWAG